MVTYRLTIGDMGLGGLYLGTIEALAETRVLIDINEWREQFGSEGVIALTFTPPTGATVTLPYELDGGNVIWAPTHESFYSAGVGEISIMLIAADGSIMARKTNQTIVENVPASTLAMTRAATTAATPETTRNALPHVIVSGRDMIIPQGIQEISVRGDSKSVRVVFDVDRYFDGVDLGMSSFFVEILNPKNQYDTVIPSTEIEGDKVCVTWEVQKKHTAVAGQIRVKLKVTANGDYIWQTHSGFFTVADTFDGSAEYIPEPTITAVEQALEEMKGIAEEIDGTYIVTVTYDTYDKMYYASKSIVDILEASAARKVVLVNKNGNGNDVYELVHIRNTEAIFMRVVPSYSSTTGEISYYTAQGYVVNTYGEAKKIVIRLANYSEVPQYAVEYNEDQDLTEAQKAQARKNIGVADATFVVNLIYDTYDKVYYPDKNYDQIVEASKSQKVFLVRGSGNSKRVYELIHIVSSGAVFARLNVQHDYTSGEVLSCLADGCVIGSDGATKFFSTKLAVDADVPTNVVQYTEQSLTDAQKAQARENIGAAGAQETKEALNSLSEDMQKLAPVHNYEYTGRDLSTIFTAAQLHEAVAAGDFTNIHVGDYWPITLNGTIYDYAGAAEKTLSNAIIKLEVAGVNFYRRHGDGSTIVQNHLLFCSRDLLPWKLSFRSENTTWYDAEATNPWLGSHLYQTLNNPSNGLLSLVAATDIGAYIYAGKNGNGMLFLGETKGPTATKATGWAWADRGKLFLPSEREVWGGDIWSEHGYGGTLALQWPIFAGTMLHIIKGLGDNGGRCDWWCCSSLANSSGAICFTGYNGIPTSFGAAGKSAGAPVCFLFS